MPEIVFVYPVIRDTFIYKSLDTLHKYTDKKKFKVIVIDQSIDGIKFDPDQVDMVIKMKNEGFAKAVNEGFIHALKWQVPYIASVNDDTEFMYSGWLEDALDEFNTDPRIYCVCPESPRVAGWGYGLPHETCIELLPHKEEYSQEDIAYLKQGDYDGAEIQSRHDFKIPESFPLEKRGIVDGVAMWLPIFKREALIELGLFDERFVWGGGEDYDMLARAYSCAWPISRDVCDERFHKRMVATMKSWVWHWWGRSKDIKVELDPRLFEGKEPWNDNGELWTPSFDVWGHDEEKGVKIPIKRTSPVKTSL